MRKLIVTEKYNNKMLNTFILDSFPELNKNMLYKALRQKDIKVNGKRIKENVYINKNDKIEVYISDENLFNINQKFVKVYEDENILIVNKR